jgi:hypothetical protein
MLFLLEDIMIGEVYDGARYADVVTTFPPNQDTSWVVVAGGSTPASSILKNWVAQPSAGDSGGIYTLTQKYVGVRGDGVSTPADGIACAAAVGYARQTGTASDLD